MSVTISEYYIKLLFSRHCDFQGFILHEVAALTLLSFCDVGLQDIIHLILIIFQKYCS